MNRFTFSRALLTMTLALGPATARADDRPLDVFDKQPTLRAATATEVQTQALAWLDERSHDPALRQQALALWAEADGAPGADALDRLAATFALAEPRARALVEFCSRNRPGVALPPAEWLTEDGLSPLVQANLRLYVGRWLARERLYDESLAHLGDLDPGDVIDPATLLFYQGAAHHWLLQREPGLKALDRLLNDVADAPRRYVSVGQLMRADLQALEDESLDHIARRMDDIDRRLDLGHAGPRVRKVEDGVIESLDKLIEQLEEQQQQQQQSAGSGGGTTRPASPAQDSGPMGGKGPGETNPRALGGERDFSDLPEKERDEILQQIGKDFPSHYRDVINQYFRRLPRAGEAEEGPP